MCRVIEALRRVTSGNGALSPARWHWRRRMAPFPRHQTHVPCSPIAALSSRRHQTPATPAPSNKLVTSQLHTYKAEKAECNLRHHIFFCSND